MYRISVLPLLLALFLLSPERARFQEPYQGQSVEDAAGFFADQAPLRLSLTASIKSLKRETNDSTYLEGTLRYAEDTGGLDSIDLRVRARGNFRRTQCYFAPLKLEFRNADIRGTLFEGHDELKLVLPCQIGSQSGDYVLKEYLAYKIFEVVSPYHYKTRLADIEFIEEKGRREKTHELTGFLIEDHSTLARRLDGKRIRRKMPPQMQDPYYSVVNNLFQYGIGNTDFSIRRQHNQRLYYIDGKYFSIPYDFDMAGLVNAPYASVSNTQTVDCDPFDVRDRCYKGYVRDTAVVEQVRQDFLRARPAILRELEVLEPLFEERSHYEEAAAYLESFYEVLTDERKFQREILDRMRE